MRSRGAGRGVARIVTAIVVVGVLGLAGCGGDDSSSSDQATPSEATSQPSEDGTTDTAEDIDSADPDLCSLFTAEDFETVTGEPAGGTPDMGQVMGPMRGSCTYNAAAGFPMVMVSAYNAGDRETTLEMVDAEPVDGLGVEAHWAPETGLLISVDGKDWYLQVLATGAGMRFDQARSVEAAELVLDRL